MKFPPPFAAILLGVCLLLASGCGEREKASVARYLPVETDLALRIDLYDEAVIGEMRRADLIADAARSLGISPLLARDLFGACRAVTFARIDNAQEEALLLLEGEADNELAALLQNELILRCLDAPEDLAEAPALRECNLWIALQRPADPAGEPVPTGLIVLTDGANVIVGESLALLRAVERTLAGRHASLLDAPLAEALEEGALHLWARLPGSGPEAGPTVLNLAAGFGHGGWARLQLDGVPSSPGAETEAPVEPPARAALALRLPAGLSGRLADLAATLAGERYGEELREMADLSQRLREGTRGEPVLLLFRDVTRHLRMAMMLPRMDDRLAHEAAIAEEATRERGRLERRTLAGERAYALLAPDGRERLAFVQRADRYLAAFSSNHLDDLLRPADEEGPDGPERLAGERVGWLHPVGLLPGRSAEGLDLAPRLSIRRERSPEGGVRLVAGAVEGVPDGGGFWSVVGWIVLAPVLVILGVVLLFVLSLLALTLYYYVTARLRGTVFERTHPEPPEVSDAFRAETGMPRATADTTGESPADEEEETS